MGKIWLASACIVYGLAASASDAIVEYVEADAQSSIELAQSIWDSVAEVPEAVEVTEEQREELNRRLDVYRDDPSVGSPWPEVRERILVAK